MKKKIIKKGDKFGTLTIMGINRVEKLPTYTATYYNCKCECGLNWVLSKTQLLNHGDNIKICRCDNNKNISNIFNKIVNKIRQLMNNNNISQAELANILGCSKQHLNFILKNNGFKKENYIFKILDKLGYYIDLKIKKKTN